jgi:hypothetical protein
MTPEGVVPFIVGRDSSVNNSIKGVIEKLVVAELLKK